MDKGIFYNNGINIQLRPRSQVRNQTTLLQKFLTLMLKVDSQKRQKINRNSRYNGPSIRGKNTKADISGSGKPCRYILSFLYLAPTNPKPELVPSVGVVPNSLHDIGRASDGAKRRPVAGGLDRSVAVRYICPC